MNKSVGIIELYNESVEEKNRENIKRRNNYIKKSVWIYTRNFNNKTNILFEIVNREVQREKMKLGNDFIDLEKAYNRIPREIL